MHINPWMLENQVFEVYAANSSVVGGDLFKYKNKVLNLLLRGLKLEWETAEGIKENTAKYIDFDLTENNPFVAVSQMKIRIVGTEKHLFYTLMSYALRVLLGRKLIGIMQRYLQQEIESWR